MNTNSNQSLAIVPVQSWDLTPEQSNEGLGNFQVLPKEVLDKIATLFSIGELSQLSLCSKSWNLIANADKVWQSFCEQEFSNTIKKTEETWKQFYKRQIETTFKLEIIMGASDDHQFKVDARLNDPLFLGKDLKELVSKFYNLPVSINYLDKDDKPRELKDADSLKFNGITDQSVLIGAVLCRGEGA